MIRQAISCDICGAEMLNANHWFVAYDCGCELRVGVWTGENRSRTAARHLCGHKCLHKLVDDYMARMQSARTAAEISTSNQGELDRPAPPTDTSLTLAAPTRKAAPSIFRSHAQSVSSSVEHIDSAEQVSARAPSGPKAMRAEAWKRERQRVARQALSSQRSIA